MLFTAPELLTSAEDNANNKTHSPARTLPAPRVMPVKKPRIFLYSVLPALRHR
jgi:hypothetical protein